MCGRVALPGGVLRAHKRHFQRIGHVVLVNHYADIAAASRPRVVLLVSALAAYLYLCIV